MIVLSEIGTSTSNFSNGTQDLIQLREAGVNDNIINAMVQKCHGEEGRSPITVNLVIRDPAYVQE